MLFVNCATCSSTVYLTNFKLCKSISRQLDENYKTNLIYSYETHYTNNVNNTRYSEDDTTSSPSNSKLSVFICKSKQEIR